MSTGPAQAPIKIESLAEQQENMKNTRKTFKVLQTAASDKENLAGRPQIFTGKGKGKGKQMANLKFDNENSNDSTKSGDSVNFAKRKKLHLQTQATQTHTPAYQSPTKELKSLLVPTDLTADENPSENYWRILAEKRREALGEALAENAQLYFRIECLDDELKTSNLMLKEAQNLVDVLSEMLDENDDDDDDKTETAEAVNEGASTSGIEIHVVSDSDEDDDN